MTASPATTSEMDQLDQLGAKALDGFLVRKDLVRKYSCQYPVPTYVVEFLLGRYCASTDPAEIEEGLQIVEKQLQGRTVRTGEEKLFKARAGDQGSVKIIDIVRARLDTRSDSYMAEVPSLAIRDAQIDDDLVRSNERMLTDGFYCARGDRHRPQRRPPARSASAGHSGPTPGSAPRRCCHRVAPAAQVRQHGAWAWFVWLRWSSNQGNGPAHPLQCQPLGRSPGVRTLSPATPG